jgi:gas vesicle structural protein
VALEHQSTRTSIIDVLDRVLDKGIVVDAWVRLSAVGIDLVTIDAHVVVAAIDTYHAAPVTELAPASTPGDLERSVRSRFRFRGAAGVPGVV